MDVTLNDANRYKLYDKCQACGAAAGQPCVYFDSNKPRYSPHIGRTQSPGPNSMLMEQWRALLARIFTLGLPAPRSIRFNVDKHPGGVTVEVVTRADLDAWREAFDLNPIEVAEGGTANAYTTDGYMGLPYLVWHNPAYASKRTP